MSDTFEHEGKTYTYDKTGQTAPQKLNFPEDTTAEEKVFRQNESNEGWFKSKAEKYKFDRLNKYPTIEECVHAILDDDLEALQAKRKAVKEKYPK